MLIKIYHATCAHNAQCTQCTQSLLTWPWVGGGESVVDGEGGDASCGELLRNHLLVCLRPCLPAAAWLKDDEGGKGGGGEAAAAAEAEREEQGEKKTRMREGGGAGSPESSPLPPSIVEPTTLHSAALSHTYRV